MKRPAHLAIQTDSPFLKLDWALAKFCLVHNIKHAISYDIIPDIVEVRCSRDGVSYSKRITRCELDSFNGDVIFNAWVELLQEELIRVYGIPVIPAAIDEQVELDLERI